MPVKAVPAKNPNHEVLERYANAEELGIAIDSDAFSATLADVENIVIDNRNMKSLLIHLFNNAGTNSFDYEILGHGREVDTPPTLAVANTDWFPLVAPTAVANNASAKEVITEDWAWIAIRLRRTTTTLDSIADVFIRALKN